MQDRVPLYPGRVKLVPVAGQENTYDMTRADQPTQAGDPLNKATLWSDVTAALFGLGVDSVPNDGFAYLGKYAQHWWKRRTISREVSVDFGDLQSASSGSVFRINTDDTPYPIQYSDSLVAISNTEVTLENPKTLNLKYSTRKSDLLTLRNQYFYTPDHNLRFGSDSFEIGSSSIYNGVMDFDIKNFYNPTASIKRIEGDLEYVQSSSRSAYPDSGEQDGYEYQYLGIPFDNAASAPKVEVGSYVGTGTYGENNPNSLTFGFKPKLVIISKIKENPNGTTSINAHGVFVVSSFVEGIYMTHGYTYVTTNSISTDSRLAKIEGNTLFWYYSGSSNEAAYQLNNGAGFSYIAFS